MTTALIRCSIWRPMSELQSSQYGTLYLLYRIVVLFVSVIVLSNSIATPAGSFQRDTTRLRKRCADAVVSMLGRFLITEFDGLKRDNRPVRSAQPGSTVVGLLYHCITHLREQFDLRCLSRNIDRK